MKFGLWLALTLVVLAAVAEAGPPDVESISLIGRYGIGHGCPVDGYIVSAAHLLEPLPLKGAPQAYTYQQGESTGFLDPVQTLISRDLGFFTVAEGGDPVFFFARAPSDPKPGDKVYWFEFNVADDPLALKRKDGKVRSIRAGHVSFRPSPAPGASGGCVFNENGDVLGVVIWSLGYKPSGIAALVTGKWFE